MRPCNQTGEAKVVDGQTNADHGHKEYIPHCVNQGFLKVHKPWVYEAGSQGD